MTTTLDPQRRVASRGSHTLSLDRVLVVLAVVVTVVLVAMPLGYLLWGSFRTAPPGAAGAVFTLRNWAEVYLGPEYRVPLLHTLLLSLAVALFSVIVGSGMAWLVARTDMPGRRALGLLLLLPIMVSPLITSLAWVALAAPNAGFLNAIWHQLHLGTSLFNIYSFPGMVLVMGLHYAAYSYLAILSALSNMDASMEEASRLLGARALRTALRMTFPLIWPAIAASFLLCVVMAAENFAVPTMLGTPEGFQTIPAELYHLVTAQGNTVRAAAVGTLLLWIALIGTIWQRRIARRARRYVTVGGKSGARSTVVLGGTRFVASGLCWIYLLLAVILPYFALLFGSFLSFITPVINSKVLTLSNYLSITDASNLASFRNSLLLCAIAALATTLFAVLIGHLIQRRLPRRLAAFTDQVVMLPNSASAMVLGIGFLWAFLALPIGIYGTWFALGIAYLTRYLGYGVRTSNATLIQLDPALEEAARMQGATGMRAFRDITFPLLRSTVAPLWMLLFVLFFLEISATILLYTPSTETFSVLVWNQLANDEQPAAFAMAVVQSTIIFAILAIGQRLFGTLRHVADR